MQDIMFSILSFAKRLRNFSFMFQLSFLHSSEPCRGKGFDLKGEEQEFEAGIKLH